MIPTQHAVKLPSPKIGPKIQKMNCFEQAINDKTKYLNELITELGKKARIYIGQTYYNGDKPQLLYEWNLKKRCYDLHLVYEDSNRLSLFISDEIGYISVYLKAYEKALQECIRLFTR